ncbi:MAG TPA: DoxX family protein [Stellaceae bacterium]|jgi:putative oxidoreductase|nr:DoxX family protein [Stellaceae bacterium]
MNDTLLLIARVLLALVFLMTVWVMSPNAGYLASVHFPAPEVFTWVGMAAEILIVISLVLGLETRWGILLGILYVVIATAFAHRYWEYTPPAQGIQYANFYKNLAIIGGLILLYLTGPGAYSIDSKRGKKLTAS